MGVTIVMLLILAVVLGGGLWAVKMFKPRTDEDVTTVEPEPAPDQKKGSGTALAAVNPAKKRYESESSIDPGSAVVQLPQHKIGSTWIETGSIYPRYNWGCICGVTGWSTGQDASREKANTHCREYKRAEELKAQTNGRFSW